MLPYTSAKAIEAFKRFAKLAERARELDPDAFKPAMAPQFTDDQLLRQHIAMRRAATNG